MLRFSRSEDYAVILLKKLSENYKKKKTTLSEISKEFGISLLLLRNVALSLRKAGIIKAKEGKSGGYELVRNPNEISFGQVLRALSDKPLFSCCQETSDGMCRVEQCPHGFSLRRLSNDFMEKVSEIKVSDFSRKNKNA